MAISKANIGQALHSVADDHVTAVANDIYDETLEKYQSDTNKDSLSGGVYNVTKLRQLQSGYYTFTTAIAAVPQALRCIGMVITYKTASDSWETKQFKGALRDWTDSSKWEDFGGGDGVYDISAANPTNGNPTPYGDLQAALTAFTDTTKKKGGMTVKFIQGTGNNAKYVQYRYLLASTAAADFNDEDNWVKDGGGSGIIEGYEEIFAKPNVSPGGFNSDGTTSDSSWCHNDNYIQIENGAVITWKAGTPFSTNDAERTKNALLLYDASHNVVESKYYIQRDRSITVNNSSVAYIRASFPYEDGYSIEINGTTVFTVDTHEGAINQLPQLINDVADIKEEVADVKGEIIVEANVEAGGLNYGNGTIASNNWCHSTEYIQVSIGDEVTWYAGDVANISVADRNTRALIVYNESKEWIGYWSYNATNRSFTIDTISSGAHAGETPKYIRASFPYEDGHKIVINDDVVFTVVTAPYNKFDVLAEEVQDAKSTAEDVAEQFDSITDRLKELSEFYSEIGYYFTKDSGGNIIKVKDNGWAISSPIECAYNDTMSIVAPSDITQNASKKYYLIAYDNNGDFITEYQEFPRNKKFEAQVLENLAYLRMSVRLSDAEQFSININNVLKYKGKDISGNLYLAIKEAIASGNTSGSDTSVPNNVSYIPLKGFIQKDLGSNWATTDSTKVVCTSAMLIPYYDVKFHISMPSTIKCKVQKGNIVSSANSPCAIVESESIDGISITSDANIRFAFYKADESDVTPQEIQELVDNGEIRVSYFNDTPNVIQKNISCESAAKAAMYKRFEGIVGTAVKSYLHNIPVFAHFSDLHGDVVRLKNIMEYCKYLGVDAAINTGDTACNKAIDGLTTYHEIVGDYDFPTLLCVGNHDAWLEGDATQGTHNEKLYNNLILPNSTKFGLTLPSASEYDNGATYYYRDFSNINIRIISVNLYEENLRNWAYYGRISQNQINWLIATLASTPANYGVIIINHVNTAYVNKDNNYNSFYDKTRGGIADVSYLTNDPIGKIVDAFIEGIEYSGSYTQLLAEGSETISYTCDFTELNEGVEFICYMNGHHHSDFVGYQNGVTKKQLVLNITTAQSLYGYVHTSKANDGDLPRGGQGSCEDAFNIYGIDREKGVVKIARIGANVTSYFEKREFLAIPYKDIE